MPDLFLSNNREVNFESVRSIRSIFEKICASQKFDEKLSIKISTVVTELLNNVVEHSQAGYFDICFKTRVDAIEIVIVDNGCEWNISNHNLLEDSIDSLLEGGRGIGLIYSATDSVKHQFYEGKNTYILGWRADRYSSQDKILIVDDDIAQAALYQEFLSDSYSVSFSSCVDKAIELINNENFALIISDINMPGKDGFFLREKLMSDSKLSLIPFIFISGDKDRLKQDRAVQFAIDDFLVKPISKADLMMGVARVLARSNYIFQLVSDKIDKTITSALFPDVQQISNNWSIRLGVRNTGHGGGDIVLQNSIETGEVLLMGDVMGHDITSKFFAFAHTGYLRGMLKALQIDKGIGKSVKQALGDFLFELNNAAENDALFDLAPLTLLAVHLGSNGQFYIAIAGSPQPLLITKEKISAINIGGMLLGLMPNSIYEVHQQTLEVGQRLAFYTDGLFDSASDSDQRAVLEREVRKTLHKTLSDPIETAIVKVMNTFDSHASDDAMDDTLIMLAEVRL